MDSYNNKGSKKQFAIVGIGMRFPGSSNDGNTFFNNLKNKKDMVQEVPKERFNAKYFHSLPETHPSHLKTTRAGLMDHFYSFDHTTFQISKKEAEKQDIAQRILLEVTLDALEDSNIEYYGSNTGVFVGSGELGFGNKHFDSPMHLDNHSSTSGSLSILPNLVSYTFNLQGPSLEVSTACSSGGSAMYLAMQALRMGDCESAIVGGVNLLFDPHISIAFSRLGVLSKDGICKSFDASANGYVRSEGIGVVVVMELEKALKMKDVKIYGVIVDCLANADGKLSPSLTQPSGKAQEILLKRIITRNDINPKDIFFSELHCTGTNVGDPIESNTVGKVIGECRDDANPLRVGCVKPNIGHCECASYMCSLIKCCLMLNRGELLPNIYFNEPNPKIKFKEYHLKVQTDSERFDPHEKLILISSFGFGGANSSTILQGFDKDAYLKAKKQEKEVNDQVCALKDENLLFPVYARSKDTLFTRIEQFKTSFKDANQKKVMERLCGFKRNNYGFYSFGVGKNISSARFSDLIRLDDQDNKEHPPVVFAYNGQGAQYLDMGKGLFKSFLAFRTSILESDKIYKAKTGVSVLNDLGMFNNSQEKPKLSAKELNTTSNTLISLVFMQLGLTDLWKSFGIKPAAVLGHSFGEIGALYCAGGATKEEIINLVIQRTGIVESIKKQGTMMAIGKGKKEVLKMIQENDLEEVYIAANNSPDAVSVGGKKESILKFAEICEKEKIFHRVLKISQAFHTPYVQEGEEQALKVFKEASKNLKPFKIPLISTVDANQVKMDTDHVYFWRNMRHEVRFLEAIETAKEKFGEDLIILEIGPHPVLSHSLKQCGIERFVGTLNRKHDDQQALFDSIGKLGGFGVSVNLSTIFESQRNEKSLELPTYPFARKNIYHQNEFYQSRRDCNERPSQIKLPTLLGRRVSKSAFFEEWINHVNTSTVPFLGDHQILGSIVAPAVSYLEAMLNISQGKVVEDFSVIKPFVVPKDHFQIVQTKIDQFGKIGIASKPEGIENQNWTIHATGKAGSSSTEEIKSKKFEQDLAEIEKRIRGNKKMFSEFNLEEVYGRFAENDVDLKNDFKGIEKALVGDEEAITYCRRPKGTKDQSFVVHPCLIDLAIQSFIVVVPTINNAYLPEKLGKLIIHENVNSCPEHFMCYLKHHKYSNLNDRKHISGDFYIIHPDTKEVLIEGKDFMIQKAENIRSQEVPEAFTYQWQSKALSTDIRSPLETTKESLVMEIVDKIYANGPRVVRICSETEESSSVLEIMKELKKYDGLVEFSCVAKTLAEDLLKSIETEEIGFFRNQKSFAELTSYSQDLVLVNSFEKAGLDELYDILVPNGLLINFQATKEMDMEGKFVKIYEKDKIKIFRKQKVKKSLQIPGEKIDLHLFTGNDGKELMKFVQKLDKEVKDQEILLVVNVAKSLKELEYAEVLGFTKVVAAEYPHWKVKFIHGDIAKEKIVELENRLELYNRIDDNGQILVPRIISISKLREFETPIFSNERKPDSPDRKERTEFNGVQKHKNFEASITKNKVEYLECPTREIDGDEILVDVEATSIIFKDVLKYRGVKGFGKGEIIANGDFSGKILAVGPLVKDLIVGDEVLGSAPISHTKIIYTRECAVCKKPKSLSHQDASCFPTAWLTSHLALFKIGGIKENDKVLIHSATSSVGQVAIMLCLAVGAKPYCTVGSQAKRDFLEKKFGISNCFGDSHSTSWYKEIEACIRKEKQEKSVLANEEYGVDIIINSLYGKENFENGLKLLNFGGRFIEIGKRDLFANTQIGINSLLKSIRFCGLHLDRIHDHQFVEYYSTIKLFEEFWNSGKLKSIADSCYSLEKFDEGLKYITKNTYMGKIIIDFSKDACNKIKSGQGILPPETTQVCDPKKTYILTGGLGALGFEVCKDLVDQGARHVVLLSRNGKTNKLQDRVLLELNTIPHVHVEIGVCDITQKEEVDKFLTNLTCNGQKREIGGIIHLAMLLRDKPINKMTPKEYEDVVGVKKAVTNLLDHQSIKKEELNFVILFSSVSAIIGNPSQGNYAAGNTWNEALARKLYKNDGIKAYSLNLGAIIDVGVIANDHILRKIMRDRGMFTGGQTAGQIAGAVRKIIQKANKKSPKQEFISQHILDFGFSEFISVNKDNGWKYDEFSHLNKYSGNNEDGSNEAATEGTNVVSVDSLSSIIKKAIFLGEEEEIDPDEKITLYGVDSLSAVELSSIFKKKFGIKITQMDILSGISVNQIIKKCSV